CTTHFGGNYYLDYFVYW
nr:immunoglobulin heavy chain junction region [Macaca mulatta]MOX59028.1 immunoglobulin heavy chain junction region [Macaca mulatta]MOX59994.1 immunoglobulin heavy chain junction region [Macaca mulatta]MOX60312.1 immunoglobulin heavy chain junction region [Macaca mulatta]MOX60645.1 immunoglobulin heavy chain junction region [Macaca mulatta]